MKKIFFILTLAILFFSGALPAKAAGASLYISPQSGTFVIGNTFNVSVFVNTGGNNINTVKVNLEFDPTKLQITSPTIGKSFITVWIAQPSFSNIEGTASFQGGIPSPGINTSAGLVSTIGFRAIAPGEAVVSIADSSMVLLDDGLGTDVLTSVGRGVYNIEIPAPEGPKVFSPTHPDQNKWSNNNCPTLSWEKESGVTDFSYSIDKSFYTSPDSVSEGGHTSISYSDLDDGTWYFHIKAKKGKVWGGITHYVLLIDTTSPAAFGLSFEPKLKSPLMTSREPIVDFITTDNLSGLSHYALKVIDLNPDLQETETKFLIEVSPPYRMPLLEPGKYEVVVRAFDNALNWRDSSKKIEVIPVEGIFFFTKSGLFIFGFFVPWNKLIPFLLILLVIILFFIIWLYLRHRKLHKKRKEIREVQKKATEYTQEVKNKIGTH